jgi:hypothetical protein
MANKKSSYSGIEGSLFALANDEVKIVGEVRAPNELNAFSLILIGILEKGGYSHQLAPRVSGREEEKPTRRAEMLPPDVVPFPGLEHGIRGTPAEKRLPLLFESH